MDGCVFGLWIAVRCLLTGTLLPELGKKRRGMFISLPQRAGGMANRLLKTWKRIKGLRGDEVRVRTRQALAAYAERAGWSAQARVPSDASLFGLLDPTCLKGHPLSAESLSEHFRTRIVPRFFAGLHDPRKTVHALRETRGPHAEERALQRACRIRADRFDLLGLRDLDFGQPIDWHFEPVSEKRAPLMHWSRINFLDAQQVGDNKIVWELNRHQYFLTLGRAYWYTHDEDYAQTFAAHLDSWMDSNPPKRGINWASSLEVAFRAISWLWALYFFRASPHLTPALFLRTLKFLYLHARHVETYLSTYFSPNTHLTGEALGLYYLGTLLPEFRRAADWRAQGKRILLREMQRHVKPDGVYFEQSSYYHRYTTDFLAHLMILGRLNDDPVGAELEGTYAALLDHLMHLTRPDGTTSFFGDDDGGRLVFLDERPANDFRAALSTGAVVLGRADYKYVAGELAEETLWLLGHEARQRFQDLKACPPGRASRAFADGGYYVLRDGWQRDSHYLFIDCGPHGMMNCGHAHADALALEVAAGGRTLLVDPGTYTYTADAALRAAFRSSAFHNTLTVDGESSSAPGTTFTWKRIARARPLHWLSHERFDFFAGSHDGYERLTPPATHLRSTLFLKRDYWILHDRVATSGTHRYDLHFHFVADADPVIETASDGDAVRERPNDKPGLEIFARGNQGTWRNEDGWVSSCYAERSRAPVLVFSLTGTGSQELVTFLVPRAAKAPKVQVRQIEACGGRAFEVHDGGVRDLVMLGAGQRVEAGPIVSDFEWAWARLTPPLGAPREFVLIGGTFLAVEGKELFRVAERVAFVVIRCLEDRTIIETDASGKQTIAVLDATQIVSGERREYPSERNRPRTTV
jgi:hypothetical protein